jgi:hypothetical protein
MAVNGGPHIRNLLAMDFKGRAIGLSNKNVIRDCGGEKCRDRVREGKSRAHDRRTVFVIVRVEKRGEQFWDKYRGAMAAAGELS